MTNAGLQLVIPTLWRPKSLVATLEHYLNSPVVERLVLIDNNPADRPASASALTQHPRLLLLSQEHNLLVNPAWNLGVAQIPNPHTWVGIFNDDIQIPSTVLEPLLEALQALEPATGTVVGLLPAGQTAGALALESFPYNPQISIGSQCRGFGSALLLRRGDYTPIPETLQIWYGDDWLLQRAQRVLGLRSGLIAIERHVTMDAMRSAPAFREQLARDRQQAPALLGWEP